MLSECKAVERVERVEAEQLYVLPAAVIMNYDHHLDGLDGFLFAFILVDPCSYS